MSSRPTDISWLSSTSSPSLWNWLPVELDMQDLYLFTILQSGLGTLYSDTRFNGFFKLLMKFMEFLVQKEGQKSLPPQV